MLHTHIPLSASSKASLLLLFVLFLPLLLPLCHRSPARTDVASPGSVLGLFLVFLVLSVRGESDGSINRRFSGPSFLCRPPVFPHEKLVSVAELFLSSNQLRPGFLLFMRCLLNVLMSCWFFSFLLSPLSCMFSFSLLSFGAQKLSAAPCFHSFFREKGERNFFFSTSSHTRVLFLPFLRFFSLLHFRLSPPPLEN